MRNIGRKLGGIILVASMAALFAGAAFAASGEVLVSAAPETMAVQSHSGLPVGNWITGAVSAPLGLRSFAVYVNGKKVPHIIYAGTKGEENLNGKWAVRSPKHGKGWNGVYSVKVVALSKGRGMKPVAFKADVDYIQE